MRRLLVGLLVLIIGTPGSSFAGPECDTVMKEDISVLDKTWNGIARADYQAAQDSLMYFGRLQRGLNEYVEKQLPGSFVANANDEVQRNISTVQDLILWQQITILKAKLELARLKGTHEQTSLRREFTNFRTVYCAYYNFVR